MDVDDNAVLLVPARPNRRCCYCCSFIRLVQRPHALHMPIACVCVCAVHAVPASCAPCAHIDSVIDIDVDYILFRWSSAWHTQNTQNAYTPAVREQTRNIRGELRPPIKMDYSHQRMCLGHERIFILCACLLWLAEVQLGQQNCYLLELFYYFLNWTTICWIAATSRRWISWTIVFFCLTHTPLASWHNRRKNENAKEINANGNICAAT